MHVLLNLSLKIIAKPFLIDVLILGFTSKSSTVFVRLTLHVLWSSPLCRIWNLRQRQVELDIYTGSSISEYKFGSLSTFYVNMIVSDVGWRRRDCLIICSSTMSCQLNVFADFHNITSVRNFLFPELRSEPPVSNEVSGKHCMARLCFDWGWSIIVVVFVIHVSWSAALIKW